MTKDKQLDLPLGKHCSSEKARGTAQPLKVVPDVKSLGEFRQQKVVAENAKLDVAIIARARHLLR